MAPTRPSNRAGQSDSDADLMSSYTIQATRAPVDTSDGLAKSRNRRDKKRKTIETEHSQRIEKQKSKVREFYEERKDKLHKAQTMQWDRMDTLVARRQAIEIRVGNHLKDIEYASVKFGEAFKAALDGRLEDIVEFETTGDVKAHD